MTTKDTLTLLREVEAALQKILFETRPVVNGDAKLHKIARDALPSIQEIIRREDAPTKTWMEVTHSEGSLIVPNSPYFVPVASVDSLIAEMNNYVNSIPIGRYNPTKGDSAYNWGKHYVAEFSEIIRKWAAQPPQPKGRKEPDSFVGMLTGTVYVKEQPHE